MRKLAVLIAAVAVCAPCIDWTRLKGTVKSVNLKASTLRIQNSDGDVFDVPIDYQVKIIEKKEAGKQLKDVQLDSKVTLIRTPSEQPKEDTEGMVPPKFR